MSSTSIPEKDNALQQPCFPQIYIFDCREKMQILQSMMHEVNSFVDCLKSMEELLSEREGGLEYIRMVFRDENAPDPRRYNAPTADGVGELIVSGDDDESELEPRNRDIVVRIKGVEGNNGLSRISEQNQRAEPAL
ncbi:hypothetical protein MAM1_0398c10313 [Mucor ambiguus]|uniref:Uncharacterized protein n=1 Tax=Mucor ambiguus TaxID=91626 RepID=A0A0C9LY84_9FUNG|nr:hypothetical protein MAM1_0398c10313 [Mucor ambiguus]